MPQLHVFPPPVLVDGHLYLLPTPEGEIFSPNAPTDATRGLITACAILLPITTLVLALRAYTRFRIERRIHLDDGFMLAAWIFDVLQISFALNMIPAGLGVHGWNVPWRPSFIDFLLPDVLSLGFFWLSSGLAKASILLFYLQLFPVPRLHLAVWLAFAFVIGYTIAGFLTNIFACRPVGAIWQNEQPATCIDEDTFYMCQAVLGIVADLVTLVIPLPMLRTLKLPWRQKMGVAFMISIGCLVFVISCYRIKPILDLRSSTDFTYDATHSMMLCIIETQLSITGGCVPMIRPFISRWWPSALGASRRSTSGGGRAAGNIYLGSRSEWARNPASHSERTPGTTTNFKSVVVGASSPAGSSWDYAGSKEQIIEHAVAAGKKEDGGGDRGLAIILKTVAFDYQSEGHRTDDDESDAESDGSSLERGRRKR